MTDQQLTVKFAKKVLGWHIKIAGEEEDCFWCSGDGKLLYYVDSEGFAGDEWSIFNPCHVVDHAMLGVELLTAYRFTLQRWPVSGLVPTWSATLSLSNNREFWSSGAKPALAVVQACLAAKGVNYA